MKLLLLKAATLITLALLALAAWAYAQTLAASFFPVVSPRPYVEMVTCAVVGALAAALVASVPLAALFASRAWLGALAVVAPVAYLRLSDIATYSAALGREVKIMGAVELGTYMLAVVGGAWLVSLLWPRPNISFKSRRSSSAA